MKTQFLKLFSLTLVSIGIFMGRAIGSPYETIFQSESQHPVVILHTWHPNTEETLNCAVILPSRKAGPSESVLKVFNSEKEIFSFLPHSEPLSLFSTSEMEPQLASIWVSGGGVYTLYVFALLHGNVVKVLEASSKMMPEFVYASKEVGDYRQRIIVSKLDWSVDPKSGKSVQLPITADIYSWDGSSYRKKGPVPWTERFTGDN
jgi:hypothetical protein